MKRRISALLLALAMVVALLPAAALAGSWNDVGEGGIGFNFGADGFLKIDMPSDEGHYTYGTATGAEVTQTAANAATLPASQWNWALKKHAADDNGVIYTLTLKDFKIERKTESTKNGDAVMLKCSLNIVLEGASVIDAPQSGTALSGSNAVLYISGDGSLELTGGDTGLGLAGGSLSISGGASVTATGNMYYGIESPGLSISGNPTVTANGAKMYGISSFGNVSISGGSVSATGSIHGICVDNPGQNSLSITGGTVKAKSTGGSAAFSAQPVLSSYAGDYGYEWRLTESTGEYTLASATPYTLSNGDAYVEIKPAGTPTTPYVTPKAAAYDKGNPVASILFEFFNFDGALSAANVTVEEGENKLTTGKEYSIANLDGHRYITVAKAYLDTLSNGSHTLTFTLKDIAVLEATLSVSGRLPASVSPTAASYNKATATAGIAFTLALGDYTFEGMSRGGDALTPGTDYTVEGKVVTVSKGYLDACAPGALELRFVMGEGKTLTATVIVTAAEDVNPPKPKADKGEEYVAANGTVYNDPLPSSATIWLKGNGLSSGDLLITERAPSGGEYDALLALANGHDVINTYNIYLRSGKKSTGSAMYLCFDLSQRYAGQEFTLAHMKADSAVEYFYCMADANGDLTLGPLYELSPFMLVQGTLGANKVTVPDIELPQTGESADGALVAGVAMLGVSALAAAAYALAVHRKKQLG